MDLNKSKVQKRIVDSLPQLAHGLLLLAPRAGKTKITIDKLLLEQPKSVLWVTPSTKLKDKDIPAEIKKWGPELADRVTTTTYTSLPKIKGKFQKVILDEYQYITEHNSQVLLNGDIKYQSILGLSGTHPEHFEKNELYSLLKLEVLYEITIDDAVDMGILADYRITVHTNQTNYDSNNVHVKTKKHDFKTTERKRYQYLSRVVDQMMFSGKNAQFAIIARMHFIYNSITKLSMAKKLLKELPGRYIYFASNIKQCESLGKNVYHSKTDDEKLKKFEKGRLKTLGMVNTGGVGFTFKNVDHFVIVQANSNKKGDITQKIARSLLHQGADYIADIHIICLEDTQDKTWVEKALSKFNSKKVQWKHLSI